MYKAKNGIFKYKSFFIVLFILVAVSFSFGQEKVEKKLDKIKGNIEKITIQTDKGEVTFEGKEADELFKKLKFSDMHRIKVIKMGDNSDENVFFISPDKIDKDFTFFSNDLKDGKKIEIKIDQENGEKTLTVTTTDKNGETTTKTYKGKEADEYLAKHGHKNFDMKWFNKNDKKGNVFFFHKSDKDSDDDSAIMNWHSVDSTKGLYFFSDKDDNAGTRKIINVSDENGTKKVTVTTRNENGKEKSETYEGKDAEEYLKKNDIKVRVKIEGDKDGKVQEIIIRKKEKKTDDK